MSDRFFFLLAVVAYGLSAVHAVLLWRKGFRRDDFVNYLLLLLGFAGHTTAVFQRALLYDRCPVYNLYEATVFFTWFIVLALLVIGLRARFRFLGAFAAPLLLAVGVFALMPWLDPPHGPKPGYSGGFRSMHAAVTLLAYASFGLSCAAAAMLVTQESNLKHHRPMALLSLLPPIARLETTVARLLLAGLVLLTLGLASGVVSLAQHRAGLPAGPDLKVIWSVLVWCGYAGIQFAHWRGWLRGRRLAHVVIAAFVFLILTFWGTNLLSPLHNPRLPPAQS